MDVAPGFRLGTTPAKTIMETSSDTGTFLGVGVSLHHGEVELVSEMEAGWYRYISRWRLGPDGVIRPRFGFAATESECVCNVHHHHAYWRFDFDIRTPAHNQVRKFNDPPSAGGGAWHATAFETHTAGATPPGPAAGWWRTRARASALFTLPSIPWSLID